MTIMGLLLYVAGFSQVKFVPTSNTNYKHTNFRDVIIYLSEEKVPKDREELGLVLCEGDNIASQMIRAKKVASDYGATGLYMMKGDDNDILTSRRKDDTEKELNANGMRKRKTNYEATMTFVAIRVPDVADSSKSKK